MPGGKHGDWYPPTLIVGTALAMFLLGSATGMWLVATPLSAVGLTASAQAGAEARSEHPTDQPAGSRALPAQAQTGEETASGSPPLAETAAASSSPAAPAAAAATPSSSASPAPPAAASPAMAQAGNFTLQFGAFLDQAKAKSVANQLAARGYAPVSVDAADGFGRTWHYVRLGGFADARAAALAASDLLGQTGIGTAIVRVSTTNAGR